jgi:peptidoglycan-associated lipoprotein
MNHARKRTLIAIAAVTLLTAACAKKKVAVAPPPPPAPAPATATAATPKPAPPPVHTATTQPPAATTPTPRYPTATTRARIDQLLGKIEDAYFDYDKFSLRPDALKALQVDSSELRDILKDYPDYKLTIEGHADERGSAEYNVALGDRRAGAAKDYLVGIGIPSAQLDVISYGKERPVCEEHDEACWQRNRRIHIVATAHAQK